MKTQSLAIAEKSLNAFAKYIEDNLGLSYPLQARQDLDNKIHGIVKAFGFTNAEECIEWIINSPITTQKIDILSKQLSIGETYFFRDAGIFDALRKQVLPEIINRNQQNYRKLNIWSTACSTGEEPYSLAILLYELIPNIKDWQINIIGSDINAHFLEIAKAGIYKPWSFRDVPLEMKRYFIPLDKRHSEIRPEIKRMVHFHYYNLVEDGVSVREKFHIADFDLIMCNNVLIYFSEKTIKEVVTKLTHYLSTDGWMVVSAIEVPHIHHEKLKYITFKNATFFKKTQEPPPKPLEPIKEAKYAEVYPPPSVVAKPKAIDVMKLYEKGEYQQVVKILEQLSTDQKLVDAKDIFILAESYANLGQTDKAKYWCAKGLHIDRVDPALHFLHAFILQQEGDINKAIAALQKVLFLDPQFALGHFELGNLMLKLHRKTDALKYYRNTLQILETLTPHALVKGSSGLDAEKLIAIVTQLKKQVEKSS